ncbi:MAG TPA: alpha/beta fold hydrolase [Rubrobacteraceae bacterium]|nr:alpha/beta fold hydrolase [Rubrobacteraceae bacterium]
MSGYRTADGLIAYRRYGEGTQETVILLHAFPLNSRMWTPQAEALAGSSRVIAPDYPGFGRSPSSPAQPDVCYYAKCVHRLLDRLGLEKVVLGGISMGGYVAFECLRQFPGRVSALVLANTRPDPDSEEIRESRREMARRVAAEGVEVLVELQMQRLLAQSTLQNDETTVELVRSMILESNPNGVVAALSAMRERPDSTPLLPEISVPTLVIGGAEDEISTPEVMGEMAAKIPNSRHIVLEGAGHLSNLEAPLEFNAALKVFLKDN